MLNIFYIHFCRLREYYNRVVHPSVQLRPSLSRLRPMLRENKIGPTNSTSFSWKRNALMETSCFYCLQYGIRNLTKIWRKFDTVIFTVKKFPVFSFLKSTCRNLDSSKRICGAHQDSMSFDETGLNRRFVMTCSVNSRTESAACLLCHAMTSLCRTFNMRYSFHLTSGLVRWTIFWGSEKSKNRSFEGLITN